MSQAIQKPSTAAPAAQPPATAPKTLIQQLMAPDTFAKLSKHCGKMLTPERLLRVACSTISRTPKLAQCTTPSMYLALTNCAQLGLEPGLSGEAYLVPFENRRAGTVEVQFIPGYQGLLKLARNSGEILSVSVNVVYKDDEFDYCLGDDEHITHKPNLMGEQKDEDLIVAYAIVKLKDGGIQRVVMPRGKIDKIRAQSKAANNGPWVTNFDEMAKKTALRAIYKLLPKSTELKQAIEIEDEFEGQKGATPSNGSPRVQPGDFFDMPAPDEDTAPDIDDATGTEPVENRLLKVFADAGVSVEVGRAWLMQSDYLRENEALGTVSTVFLRMLENTREKVIGYLKAFAAKQTAGNTAD